MWGMCATELCAALELDGDLVQGAVVTGRTAPGATVLLNGELIPVDEEGRFLIGFDRDASATAELRADGERYVLDVQSRNYAIQRVEGIPRKIMNPSKDDLERIRRESAKVAAARRRYDLRRDFDNGFKWPVLGPISGVYGSQRFYNGEPSRPHYGVDVAVPSGTPVAAPAPGIVTLSEADLFYSGGTVIIDHGHGLSSSFLHMSRVIVAAGEFVAAGDIIGEVGATGRATGPHLDWRMNWRGARVDPQRLVGDMPVVQ